MPTEFSQTQPYPTPRRLLEQKGRGLSCKWNILDTTEQLHFHFSLSCIGEGNGNPLSVLAWRIPRTGEPGGLPSMGSHRVGRKWSDLAAETYSLLLTVLVFVSWCIFLVGCLVCCFCFAFLSPLNSTTNIQRTVCVLDWKLHECMLSCFSCIWLFVTLGTVAHQVPLSMDSPLPFPIPGDLPNPGI